MSANLDDDIANFKAGFETSDLADNTNIVKGIFDKNIAGVSTISSDSALGQFVAACGEWYYRLKNWILTAVLSNYISTASGDNLDYIGTDVKELPRLEAQSTYTIAIFTNSSGSDVLIPASTSLVNTATNEVFLTTKALTILANNSGQVECLSEKTGVVLCDANSLSLETPITDITVANTQGILGNNGESDGDYRARLSLPTTLKTQNLKDSLYLQLISINEVKKVTIFDNKTNTTDTNGVPAKSFEVLIQGGNDLEVARTIYNNTGVGNPSAGTELVQVTSDVNQSPNEVRFSRPGTVSVVINATLTVNPNDFKTSDIVKIQNSIVALINTILNIGENVRIDDVASACFVDYSQQKERIAGVNDADIVINGSSVDLGVSYNQIATTSISNVAVST